MHNMGGRTAVRAVFAVPCSDLSAIGVRSPRKSSAADGSGNLKNREITAVPPLLFAVLCQTITS
jgi:hypothetical protein